MQAVRSHLQIVVLRVLLPGNAPVRSDATDVYGQRISGTVQSSIGLRSSDVRRTVDSRREIQVVVPHGVPAKSRDVLRQSSIDDRSGGRSGRPITAHPRVSPGRRTVPEIFHGGIVVYGNSIREI